MTAETVEEVAWVVAGAVAVDEPLPLPPPQPAKTSSAAAAKAITAPIKLNGFMAPP
jgi:hypothetical protein